MTQARAIAIGFGTAELFPDPGLEIIYDIVLFVENDVAKLQMFNQVVSASEIWDILWILRRVSDEVILLQSNEASPIFDEPSVPYRIELTVRTKHGVIATSETDIREPLDLTPPAAPTGLSGTIDEQNILVTKDAHPDENTNLKHIRVGLVVDNTHNFSQVITLAGSPAVVIFTPGEGSQSFLNVPEGDYYLVAEAEDLVGRVSTPLVYSTILSIVPPIPAAPDAATGLTATALADGTIRLNWTNPGTGTTPSVIDVHMVTPINAGMTADSSNLIAQLGAAVAQYIVPSLQILTGYSFAVVRRNAGGGTQSNVASATTLDPGALPVAGFDDDFSTYADTAAMNAAYQGGGFTRITLVNSTIDGVTKKRCRYEFPETAFNQSFDDDITTKHRRDFGPNVTEAWIEIDLRVDSILENGIPNYNTGFINLISGQFLADDLVEIRDGLLTTNITLVKDIIPTTRVLSGGGTHSMPWRGGNLLRKPLWFANFTGVAATDVLTCSGPGNPPVAHGFANNEAVRITSLNGGAGLLLDTVYYVVNATSTTLKLSLTPGGAAIDFTTDIVSAVIENDGKLIVNLSRPGTAEFVSPCIRPISGGTNPDWKLLRIWTRDIDGGSSSRYWAMNMGVHSSREMEIGWNQWGVGAEAPVNQNQYFFGGIRAVWNLLANDALHKLQIHAKVSSAFDAPDGAFQVMIDGVPVYNRLNYVVNQGKLWYVGFGENRNQGCIDKQGIWWERRRWWTGPQNPGGWDFGGVEIY